MSKKTIYFVEMVDENGKQIHEKVGPFEKVNDIVAAVRELVNPSKTKKRGKRKKIKIEDLDGYRKVDLKKILDLFEVPYMYKDTITELKEKVINIKGLEELPKRE